MSLCTELDQWKYQTPVQEKNKKDEVEKIRMEQLLPHIGFHSSEPGCRVEICSGKIYWQEATISHLRTGSERANP